MDQQDQFRAFAAKMVQLNAVVKATNMNLIAAQGRFEDGDPEIGQALQTYINALQLVEMCAMVEMMKQTLPEASRIQLFH